LEIEYKIYNQRPNALWILLFLYRILKRRTRKDAALSLAAISFYS